MRPSNRKRLVSLLLVTLVAALLAVAGCNQAAKKPALTPEKPPAPLAPEVTQYKSEPNISLYRSASGQKQELKLEEYLKGVVAS